MKLRKTTQVLLLASSAVLLFAFTVTSVTRAGHRNSSTALRDHIDSDGDDRHCSPVGGTIMTNFGAIDQSTTMGTATGDLRGAVSGTLLGTPESGAGGTVIFHVQHHWVTETGDTLFFDPATATTVPIAKGLFAVLTYPVHLTGGTGKFAGATGDFSGTGEVNLPNFPDITGGVTVFRYSGQVCYSKP